MYWISVNSKIKGWMSFNENQTLNPVSPLIEDKEGSKQTGNGWKGFFWVTAVFSIYVPASSVLPLLGFPRTVILLWPTNSPFSQSQGSYSRHRTKEQNIWFYISKILINRFWLNSPLLIAIIVFDHREGLIEARSLIKTYKENKHDSVMTIFNTKLESWLKT